MLRFTQGRITKTCENDHGWHKAETPCHYEVKEYSRTGGQGGKFRQWVCHCRTTLCQFVDYQEVEEYRP
jgi:hypothetical protein